MPNKNPESLTPLPTPSLPTPMMRQFYAMKERYPAYLLLFRMGDFYETFDEDAVIASEILGITLTSRNKGKEDAIPLAGIPIKALDTYLPRLLAAGKYVALAEQLEDPAQAKGLVERGVVRLYTPGTLYEDELLPDGETSYLAALAEGRRGYGLALTELSTGELLLVEFTGADARDRALAEVARRAPRELLLPEAVGHLRGNLVRSIPVTLRADNEFRQPSAGRRLRDFFSVTSLTSFGVEELKLAQQAAGGILAYLEETQLGNPVKLRPPQPLTADEFLRLDPATVDSLELVSSAGDRSSSKRSLLALLDRCLTPPGKRLLRRWLIAPLARLNPILSRQSVIAELVERPRLRESLRNEQLGMGDLERSLGRLSLRRAFPRDLALIRNTLRRLPELKKLIAQLKDSTWSEFLDGFQLVTEPRELLEQALVEEPGKVGSGGVIATGYNQRLDEAGAQLQEAEQWLRELQKTERERTGISGLKVGFNRVFGYYIEVQRSKVELVPAEYQRKQTLVAAERFITPELKEKEAVIARGREHLSGLEANLFRELVDKLTHWLEPLTALSAALARLDVAGSLAEVAALGGWTRPRLNDSREMTLVAGRHPLVERWSTGPFVPNDCSFGEDERRLMVLTGPNMAGKSTYLRQVGLIVILAQMGSFVPAGRLRLGLVDAIFTRVGAADDIARGLSTFMVEMTETARIVNCATSRSLLLLDEVGRGTSTSDGVAIAWAVAEYLHNSPRLGARTIFATHYHELVRLVESLPACFNEQMAISESGGEIRFLHQVKPGAATSSYGVHVAQLAGLPKTVIRRANTLLRQFEKEQVVVPSSQLSLSVSEEETLDHGWLAGELRSTKPEGLTPLSALNLISQWHSRLTGNTLNDSE